MARFVLELAEVIPGRAVNWHANRQSRRRWAKRLLCDVTLLKSNVTLVNPINFSSPFVEYYDQIQYIPIDMLSVRALLWFDIGWFSLYPTKTTSLALRQFFDCSSGSEAHDDVIKWKHFPRYWPFVRGIHRSLMNSPHKGQWRGALIFSFICSGINGWINNNEAGDLRCRRAHYDVTVISHKDCRLISHMNSLWTHILTTTNQNKTWPYAYIGYAAYFQRELFKH